MPRYFFHLFNDETALDEEGLPFGDDHAALDYAAGEARTMAAESVSRGHLMLDHRIDVVDESGRAVGTVHFRDAVKIVD